MRALTAAARQTQIETPMPSTSRTEIAAAMSSVAKSRSSGRLADPQGAIDRAIATLDREARGDAAGDERQ